MIHLIDLPRLPGHKDSKATLHSPIITINEQHLQLADTARIDSMVKLECGEAMYIGEYVHIASFCHLGIGGGVVVFEDGSCAGSGTRIVSGSNVPGRGHGCSAVGSDVVFKKSFVRIGKNATLFVGVTVLPGVKIGKNAVVAAGAVVLCNVPAYEIWAGVPARQIGQL